ncbi:MAG TPA: hypothetical protein VEU97_16475 [Ktedonobacteraceae bacterium]|nr:hypothetical protein [Ktedonobacteraceae bacterium]
MSDEYQGPLPGPERISPTAITEPIPVVHAWPPAVTNVRRRETLPTRTIILVILLAVALIGSGLGLAIYATTAQYRASLHGAASAIARFTAQVQATSQAQQQGTANVFATANSNIYATASAQAGATATLTAQVSNLTATTTTQGNILSQATSGTPVLDDPLSDNSNNNRWDVTSGTTDSACVFINGTYHAIEARAGFFQPCLAEATNFSDFAYQVNMMIDKGKEDGIIFRADSANSSFYMFRINTSGSYALDLYRDSKFVSTLTNGYSTAITTTLKESNVLAVVAYKGTFYLYDNQQLLTSVSDNTLSSGKIGVAAIDYTQPTEAEFSNAQVWNVTASTFTTTPTVTASPTVVGTTTPTAGTTGSPTPTVSPTATP